MLNERVMILCVVWKGFRHLPEMLGEGVAPWLSWCCDTGKREGGTVEKAEGQRVWPQSGEGPQRARKKRVRERNRKCNYHEAHLKLNLQRADLTAGDWHTLDGLCSITGEIHTYSCNMCVIRVFKSGIILLLTAILQDKICFNKSVQ